MWLVGIPTARRYCLPACFVTAPLSLAFADIAIGPLFREPWRSWESSTPTSDGFLLLGSLQFVFLLSHFLSPAMPRNQSVLSTLGLEIPVSLQALCIKLCFCLAECRPAKSCHCNKDHLFSSFHRQGLASLWDLAGSTFHMAISSNMLLTVQNILSETIATFSIQPSLLQRVLHRAYFYQHSLQGICL